MALRHLLSSLCIAALIAPAAALAGQAEAPSALTATAQGQAVQLAWTASDDSNLTEYRIYRRTAGGEWSTGPVAAVDPASTAYVDEGLAASTTYAYRVTAFREGHDESTPSNEASATTAAADAPAPTYPSTATVDVGSGGSRTFSPSTVTIAAGGTVTWRFQGDTHNVVGSGFSSGNRTSGEWSHTFSSPGSFRYLCTLHSGMAGTVRVVDPARPEATPETPTDAPGTAGADPASDPATATGPTEAVPARTHLVRVGNFAFGPSSLLIRPGDTVRWRWVGMVKEHSVTATDGSFESHPGVAEENLGEPAGGMWEHRFGREGTFTYFCRLHPEMRGTVKVVQGAATSRRTKRKGARGGPRLRALRVRVGRDRRVRISFVADKRVRATVTAYHRRPGARKARPKGRLSVRGGPGRVSRTWRRLGRGQWKFTIRAADGAGNRTVRVARRLVR